MKLWELGEFLQEAGIENRFFYFEGSRSNKETDFPQRLYFYDTPAGYYSKYTTGKEAVGDWIRVLARYYPGDAATASIFYAVYVHKKDVERAKKLLKKYSKSDIYFRTNGWKTL